MPTSSRTRLGEQKTMRLMLIGGGLLFCVIVAGVVVPMIGGKPQVAAVQVSPPPSVAKVVQPSAADLAGDAETLARKFLSATTVDEILTIVRNPGLAESRMREFYPDGKIEAVGLSQFDTGGGEVTRGKFHAFSILTRDHEQKSLTFVETPQGLKVDWESWVGWSDIPWQKFLTTKPTESHVFRVTVVPLDYYNFGFSDDQKWQSYRLESPDQEHTIYGYVERDSALNVKLHSDASEQEIIVTLALKFPSDPQSNSQVEIERLVGEGWVDEEGTP